MSAATQGRLVGEFPDGSVTIETSGRTIKPGLAIPAAIVDESRVWIDDDGVHSKANDPADVVMYDHHIHAEAFEAFDSPDDMTVGINLDRLTSTLSQARVGKGTDDPVTLEIDGTTTVVEIEREYDTDTITYADQLLNLGPDGVREPPSLSNIALPTVATVGVDAFKDAVEHINSKTDHITIGHRDGDLILSGEGDAATDPDERTSAAVSFADAIEECGDERVDSTFSLDYMTQFTTAAKKAKVDSLTLHFGDELPIQIDYERTAEEGEITLYDGAWMSAPRVSES